MSSLNLQHRKLAILLLDIVSSTAYIQKVGELTGAKVLQHHDRLTRSICYKNSGREIDRSDGFLMSFENVTDAVNFALDYVHNVTSRIKLQSRIGIHWGSIVEVYQDQKYVEAGAKRVELEGISKNIAARTMSLALPSQILLTEVAYTQLRKSTNSRLNSDVRFGCVGLYKFKGVKDSVTVYAVAKTQDIHLLQPPLGNAKAKRLGGPTYIKKRARDRNLLDKISFAYNIFVILTLPYILFVIYFIVRSEFLLEILGLHETLEWANKLVRYLEFMIKRLL